MDIQSLKQDAFFIQNIVSHDQTWGNHEGWYSYLRRKRPDHGLIVITNGKAVYTTKGGMTVNAMQGDIVFLPKNAEYKVVFSTAEDMKSARSLLVNFLIKDTGGNDIELSDRIELLGRDQDGRIRRIISEMPKLYCKNEWLLLKSRFYELADEMIRCIINASSDRMASVLRYIENNICATIHIADLAKLCAMSESSFRKQFKNMTGVSPVKYINKLKIDKAKRLLISSEISVEEICDFLHFYDKSYFYKIFKEMVGMTPIQYRDKKEAQ